MGCGDSIPVAFSTKLWVGSTQFMLLYSDVFWKVMAMMNRACFCFTVEQDLPGFAPACDHHHRVRSRRVYRGSIYQDFEP